MESFKNLNKSQLLKFLAIIAMSDGCINSHKNYKRRLALVTSKNSVQQHELLNYLSKKVINKNIAFSKNKKFLDSRIYSTKLVNMLLKLSPCYKTTPYKDKNYLSKPQPTLRFIFNENKNIQMLAFRMWFDFEGAVVPHFRLANKFDRGKYFSYDLAFLSEIFLAETNPNLIKDLVKLSNNLGFKATIKKDKRKWSGIDGIRIHRNKDIINFVNFGGPLTNVKISNKSKRFGKFGFTKKSICLATKEILNWKKLHWSFQNKKEAIKLKQKLDKILFNTIKKYDK